MQRSHTPIVVGVFFTICKHLFGMTTSLIHPPAKTAFPPANRKSTRANLRFENLPILPSSGRQRSEVEAPCAFPCHSIFNFVIPTEAKRKRAEWRDLVFPCHPISILSSRPKRSKNERSGGILCLSLSPNLQFCHPDRSDAVNPWGETRS